MRLVRQRATITVDQLEELRELVRLRYRLDVVHARQLEWAATECLLRGLEELLNAERERAAARASARQQHD